MYTITTPKRVLIAALPLMVLLVLSLVSIAACSQNGGEHAALPPVASETVVVTPSSSVPNDAPSIRGYITRITNSAESTEILVEYFLEKGETPEYAYEKVLIKLDGNTAVDSDNGTIITIASLNVGAIVDVWFSEPSVESYPVLAYGQAIRLITSGNAINGLNGVPQLAVIGSSKSLAGVVEAQWTYPKHDYKTTLSKMLDSTRGAYITAAPGSTLVLNFSSVPKAVKVTWAGVKTQFSLQHELEVGENNDIVIPEDASGEIFIRVTSEWARGTVMYGFSVSIVEQN